MTTSAKPPTVSPLLPRIGPGEWLVVAATLAGLAWILHHRCLGGFIDAEDWFPIYWMPGQTPRDWLSACLLMTPHPRPFSFLVYNAVISALHLHAPAYHVLSLILHVVSGVVLYWLAYRLSGRRFVAWAALAGFVYQFATMDALWVFSSLHDMLAALFGWMAVAWYIEARSVGGWRRMAGIAAFLLALNCKEHAAALPFLLTLYERLWHPPAARAAARRAWRVALVQRQWPYYGLLLLFLIPRFLDGAALRSSGIDPSALGPTHWLQSLDWYLRLWFRNLWPAPVGLLIGMLAVVLACIRRSPVLGWACAWVVLTLGSLILWAEHPRPHHWYLPQFGMLLYIGALTADVHDGLAHWMTHWHLGAATPLLAAATLSLPLVTALPDRRARLQKREREGIMLEASAREGLFIRQLQRACPRVPRRSYVLIDRGTLWINDDARFSALLRVMLRDRTVTGMIHPELRRPAAATPIDSRIVYVTHDAAGVVRLVRQEPP